GTASKWFSSSEATSNVPTLSVTYHGGDANALLSDPAISEDQAKAIAATPGASFTAAAYTGCPGYNSQLPTPIEDQVFKHLPSGDSLTLDVYKPPVPTQSTQYAALVLLFGGGWWRGCKNI